MLSVNLGPLGLSVDRVAVVLAFLVALGVGWLVGRRRNLARADGVGAVLPDMLLAGMLVGRVAFVARWFDSYRAQPWSVLDIRDGGFDVAAGLAAALLLALWKGLRRPKLRLPLATGLAAGALVWGGLAIGVRQIHSSMPGVPDTTLHSLAGESTTLAALAQGRPIVVNLWATWCPPCVREMPVLAAAQQREQDIVFVFVNQGEGASRVERFLTERKLGLDNMLIDSGGGLAQAVGSRAMPTTLFYDAQGRLVDAHLGALSRASLAAKIERIRAGASR